MLHHVDTSAGRCIPTAALPPHLFNAVTECSDAPRVFDVTRVKAGSVDYSVGDVFHVGCKEGVAIFGKIEEIVIAGDEVFLSVHLLRTQYFSRHRSAYIVVPSDFRKSYSLGQFEDYCPLDMYTSKDCFEIVSMCCQMCCACDRKVLICANSGLSPDVAFSISF